MKKIFLIIAMAATAFSLASCEGSYIVTSQPVAPYYDRPVAPGADYIWIDGDWVIEGGHYVWHNGYWDHPRSNRSWQSEHWEQRNNGWRWNRGRWR